ncbi:uncharacterized protein BJX67DRAFT_359083 [Aspergillus lucknowensis]|uniref:F-box domain-containing protein n=1 Tax=Aspergillus lucknowensis TaxID=176173 RepID=A0ABR4LLB8_9EURO
MVVITSMPDELLCLIFQHYQNHKKQSVLPWLLGSRRLYTVAIPLLYRHISVSIYNVPLLLRPSDGIKHTLETPVFKYTRSLSIWLPAHTSDPKPQLNDTTHYLRSVEQVVSMMNSLASLSIAAESGTTFGDRTIETMMNCIALARILKALPPSLTSLELCTPLEPPANVPATLVEEWYGPQTKTGCCLICQGIREILPRLHHIRLRLPTLCPALLSSFGDVSSPSSSELQLQLRTALIWFSTGRCQSNTMPCDWNPDRLYMQWELYEKAAPMRSRLISDARKLYLAKALPHIQHFVFPDVKPDDGLTAFPITTDIIAPQTSASVLEVLSYRGEGQARISDNPDEHTPHTIRIMDSPHPPGEEECTCTWSEYVGALNGLLPLIEGKGHWKATRTKVRLPSALAGSSGLGLGSTFDCDPGYEEASVFRARSDLSCSMWRYDALRIEPGHYPGVPGTVQLFHYYNDGGKCVGSLLDVQCEGE